MEESYMNVLASSVIYENPLPQLRSRQSAFPFLCELPGGMLLASHAIGEAFESVDGTTYLSRSEDGGPGARRCPCSTRAASAAP